MYKVASAGAQSAKDRGRLADWVEWEDDKDPETLRQSLVRAVKSVDARLAQAQRGSEERKALGLEKLRLQTKINSLRAKRKGPQNVPEHFVEEARARLPHALFKIILAAASKRAEEAQNGA